MHAEPPLPPYLMTSEPGSFARKTIAERKAQIIARVIADHAYDDAVLARLAAFRDEIMHPDRGSSSVRSLSDTIGDAAVWHTTLAPYRGHTWLQLPWYLAETYFYRRLLEAIGHFDPASPNHLQDPFAPQKRAQEAVAVEQLAGLWPILTALPDRDRFESLLHGCLWGNRADLSNFTITQRPVGDTMADRHNILIDHTHRVGDILAGGPGEIAFINDNVGADSLFDLALADCLLDRGRVRRVTFHLKNRPFFVSDAMPGDILAVIRLLTTQDDAPGLARLGARLSDAVAGGRLILATQPFWTQPFGFRELPDDLRDDLKAADLVILKGDVNYRRLLDDRHWPPSTPLAVAAADFPRPFLILRTLKGEIIAGLAPDQAEARAAEDPTWLINGRRGLIHLVT